MKKSLVLLLGLTLALSLAGCGKDDKNPTAPPDPAGSQVELDAGNTALGSGDYAAANEHYDAALAKDPGNSAARLGVAVTEVYLVQQDPEVAPLLDYLGSAIPAAAAPGGRQLSAASPLSARLGLLNLAPSRSYDSEHLGRAVFRIMGEAVEDPPAISRIQQIIRTRVMPRLQLAENHLNLIEADADFVFKLPPAATHLEDSLEIDVSDIYLLDSVVNGVQGFLGMIVAYNFDVPNNDFEHMNPESLLAEGTDWATLHAHGALELAASRTNLLLIKTRLDQAAASLAAETDDQSDDLIPQEILGTNEFADLQSGVTRAYDSLQGPITVSIQDDGGNPFDMQLYAGRFFVPAIQDLKTLLPTHTFDAGTHEPQITSPLTFPDPTINGIFPDMTNERWQQLTGMTPPVFAATR